MTLADQRGRRAILIAVSLAALADVDAGLEGNLVRAATGLRTLRALDQEDIARQAAVELMLTPRILSLHASGGR